MEIEDIALLLDKKKLTASDKRAVIEACRAVGLCQSLTAGCTAAKFEEALLALYEQERARGQRRVSKDGWRLKNEAESFRAGGVLVSNATIESVEVGNFHPVVIAAYFEKVEEKKENGQDC